MKRALALLLFLAGCSATPAGTAPSPSPAPTLPAENPAPGNHETAFRDGQGTLRRYIVHAPPSYPQSKPHPLVLVFHGSPGVAEEMPLLTKMNEVADAHGFLVVYPRHMYDTAAIAALIDHLTPKWNVDPKRVHAAGFSRGGTFIYELAEKLPERFGSVSPVSASGGTGNALTKPPSLITFQGGQDRLRQAWSSTNSNWAKSAGCSGEKVSSITMEGGPTHIYATTCTGGAEHVVYSVTAMSHLWPADASKLIWDFFSAHPLA
ncbi:MAG TPA: PHB depolymerase family esterase [Candidatus Limnocylindrales bacterium]